nr:Chain C, GTS1 peptide [dengue virus type 1]5WJL_F Chain F, GTS1 peptide [dengue virus type 1]5WJL_I Chain I, GTS1 peptide [dengue virus type 1]5WKF_C Chain C, GTS1 peptide [dengue virus type 1]5WKF_H Chain H, GTS1 peptide [dengue virus type 1]
GTSGSPIVNR